MACHYFCAMQHRSQTFPDSNEGELEMRLREADMELTELRLEQLASIQNIEHLQEKINLLEVS